MSAHGHATPGDAAASHDHHFEGIPADRPGPDEPRTPLWLPLVGMGLFLSGLLAYVITRPPGKTGAELAKEAEPSTDVEAAPAVASAPSPRVRRLPPGFPSAFPPGAQAPGAQAPGAATGGAAPRPMRSAPVRAAQPPGAARPNPGGAAPAPAPAQ